MFFVCITLIIAIIVLQLSYYFTNQSALKQKDTYIPFNQKNLIADTTILQQPEDHYLVYIYEDYCEPCTKYEEELKKYVRLENSLPLYKVNIDKQRQYPELPLDKWLEQYDLTHTPSILEIKNNQVFRHYHGPVPNEHLPLRNEKAFNRK